MLKCVLPSLVLSITLPTAALADEQTYEWSLKGTNFDPPELTVAAAPAFTLKFTNTNAEAGELECKGLKIEKAVVAGGTIMVRVLNPKAGSYLCVNEPQEDKAKGTITVK